jgi:hypothetical protein
MTKNEMSSDDRTAIPISYRLIFIGVNWSLAVGSLLVNESWLGIGPSILGILFFFIFLPFGFALWGVGTFGTPGRTDLIGPALLSLLFHVILFAGILIPRRRTILMVCAILFLATLALDTRGCQMIKDWPP